MSELEGLKEIYLAIGVGGVSFIVLVAILGYLLRHIFPLLNNIMKMLEVLKEVLQNNTKAIDEMAKSNQNVATALELLKRSMTSVETKLGQVQDSNENIEKSIIRLEARAEK